MNFIQFYFLMIMFLENNVKFITYYSKAVRSTEKVLDDLGNRAEDAGIAASAGAQQLPLKLEGRSRDIEHELNRTVQVKY